MESKKEIINLNGGGGNGDCFSLKRQGQLVVP